MATTPTKNEVPSESPRDLKFNAGKIDEFVTSKQRDYEDRFGNKHYTVEGLRWIAQQAISSFGYITMDSFQDGATLTLPNQVLRWKKPDGDGEYYRWDGEFPKNVNPDSTPQSAGGIGDGAWLSVGSAVLTELDGSTLGYRYQGLPASSKRTVRGKLDEYASLWDFHCDSNGNVIQPGPSVDSRPYIQAAIDYLNANGGGTLNIPTGTWYLSSYGNTDKIGGYAGVIQLLSRVDIRFDAGSKIKLTSFFNEKPYCVFCGFNGNDPATSASLNMCNIYGYGTIDCGENNIQPKGGALCYAIGTGRSYDCSIRGITITNGDLTWAATLGWNGYGNNTVVDGVTVTNCKKSDIDRNIDQSLFYVGCPYSGVRNSFMNPSPDTGFANRISAAVELHQNNTFCDNNHMFGFMRAVYVVMHPAESGGQGYYMYNISVCNNVASFAGQFVTITADQSSGITYIHAVKICNNIATVEQPNDPNQQLGRIFINSEAWANTPLDSNTEAILVADNIFRCPINLTGSVFFAFRISTRNYHFSGNLIDCQKMVSGDGQGVTNNLEVRNIVWDSTNTIGNLWVGNRGGNTNLFDIYAAGLISCHFDINLNFEDVTIANVFYAPGGCSIEYTTVKVSYERIPQNVTAVGVSQANLMKVKNHFSYPATIDFSSYSATGATLCFSTGTSFEWVGLAQAISEPTTAGLVTPSGYIGTTNGQLKGTGYAESTGVKSYKQRVILHSRLELPN